MTDNSTSVLQSFTDGLRVEHGLCSDTSVQSSVDSSEVITVKIMGEVVCIKEEGEPLAISFPSIKEEPEVSPQTFHQGLELLFVIMLFCLPAFPHKSAPCGEW
jgi:hypothetical protein